MPSLTREEAAALLSQGSRQTGDEVRIRLAGKGRGGGAAPTRKEREIQAAILAYLKTVPGVVAWRQNTGAMFGEHKGKRWAVRFGYPGLSDIIGWQHWCGRLRAMRHPIPGSANCDACSARFLAIEVKRPGQYPTAQQQAFLDSVKAAGGIAIVARSVDDVARTLAAPRGGEERG